MGLRLSLRLAQTPLVQYDRRIAGQAAGFESIGLTKQFPVLLLSLRYPCAVAGIF